MTNIKRRKKWSEQLIEISVFVDQSFFNQNLIHKKMLVKVREMTPNAAITEGTEVKMMIVVTIIIVMT